MTAKMNWNNQVGKGKKIRPVSFLLAIVKHARLEQYVDDEDVEHILEGVDHAVEHSLELGDPLDGLERPQDAEHAQGLDRAQVLAS